MMLARKLTPTLTKKTTHKVAKKPVPRRFYSGGGGHPLTSEEVTARLITVLKGVPKVDKDAITPKAHFQKDLGLDSLEAVEVTMAIEDEFCIEIPDSMTDNINSVEDACNYIITHPHAK